MGQGRLPIPEHELEVHLGALGSALADGVKRDFGDGAAVRGMRVSVGLVENLARGHAQVSHYRPRLPSPPHPTCTLDASPLPLTPPAQLLYANYQQMSERLNEANASGEINRKAEMKRIFGIDI